MIMTDPVSGPTPHQPHGVHGTPEPSEDQKRALKKWKEFLGPKASWEDAMRFMNTYLNQIIGEIKKEDAKAKKAAIRMKKIIEGRNPDE